MVSEIDIDLVCCWVKLDDDYESLLRKYNKNILFLLCIPMYSYIIKPSDVKDGERYIPDIPAIKSEKINSFEIGYKKIFDFGAIMSLDYYVNHYKETFQHGGVSMEEMMIPMVTLIPKK